jgi:hypothetical protein
MTPFNLERGVYFSERRPAHVTKYPKVFYRSGYSHIASEGGSAYAQPAEPSKALISAFEQLLFFTARVLTNYSLPTHIDQLS